MIGVFKCHSDDYTKNGLGLGVASMKTGKQEAIAIIQIRGLVIGLRRL